MSEPTTSLREALESALEAETSAAAPAPAPEPAQPAEQPTAAATDDLVVDVPDLTEDGEQDLEAMAEASDNSQAQQQARDEQGKFKKSEPITPGPKSGPKPQADRAPASWKPDVREHWGQLPETVRSEIARRETEVQRTLQETAEARKTAEAVMRTIAPYEAFIKAENSNPLQAIDNLMSTAAKLRTGTAPELAQMVAGIVNQFGVGRFGNSFIEQLDSALAGQQPRQADTTSMAVQQAVQQQLAPVQQMLSQFQQAQQFQQERIAQQAASEVEQFLSKAEFGEDVREDMADIIETASRRGQTITLSDAYKKACLVNDGVRQVMIQRQQAQGAQQQTQAAQRARQAAVSVSGGAPVGALKQEATDIRSAIEAAIQMTSR